MKPRSLLAFAVCALLLLASGCGGEPANAPAATTPDNTSLSWETGSPTDPLASDAPTDEPTTEPTATGEPSQSPAPTDTPAATTSAEPTEEPSATGTALTVAAVTGKAKVTGTLTLRKTADSTSTSLAKIPANGSMTVLSVEEDPTWLKVKYSSKTGYVMTKYVSLGSTSYKVCTIKGTANINVRNSASSTGKVMGIVKPGTTLLVTTVTTSNGTTWYKVKLSSSTSGYLDSKYTRTGSAE